MRLPCRTGKPVPTFPGKAGQQGNVLAVTGNTGAIEQHFFYTPFGVELEGDASGNPFRYTGRRYDAETGLYYYRARYYDADLGRFLQVDPVGYADQWNLYAYVGNNPLNATDPSGEDRVAVTTHGDQFIGIEAWDDGSADTTVTNIHYYSASFNGVESTERTEFTTTYHNAKFSQRGVQEAIVSQISALTGQQYSLPSQTSRLGELAQAFIQSIAGAGPPQGRFDTQAGRNRHFADHGSDFGARNAVEYEQQASRFLTGRPGQGVLQGVRRNGDRVRFNPATNEFGVIRSDGSTIRTYFRPDPIRNGKSNLDYFFDSL